ncbi:MAG: putative hydrolase of the superfamily [Acidimicrobiia bacterium]|nr:putative hydrolase of the superfamily [Acidimicrobiia bacterium]
MAVPSHDRADLVRLRSALPREGGGVQAVGIDGDDTLWHSEIHFELTQQRIRELLAPFVQGAEFDQRLLATERANLRLFGYGVKGFALSTIETAIELTGERIPARDIRRIIDCAKELLDHPVELVEHVDRVTAELCERYPLVLITKGDLFHQQAKLAASGLGERFAGVEIVAEKDPVDYQRVLGRYGIDPARFVMVGNSMRSDVLPAVEVGGRAVYIPYQVTWAFEHAELPEELNHRVVRLDHFGQLPDALEALARSS